MYTHRHVGSEAGDQGSSDSVWNGGVGALGFLSCGGNDVKPNEGVEAGGCTLHDLCTDQSGEIYADNTFQQVPNS